MVKAIDVHVHPSCIEMGEASGKYAESAVRYFGLDPECLLVGIEDTAKEYRDLDMMAVLLAWDAESYTGLPRLTNDFIAKAVKEFPEVFVGFACVDPWKGKMAEAEVERAIGELGLIGVKFQQSAQGFYPDDQRFYPLWQKISELGVPVMFHMGTTGFGAFAPGGHGIKLGYSRPIPHVDSVAADFPELTVICAHPGWPWTDEVLAIGLHKTNVFMDLSGWAPRHFPKSLIQHANRGLQDKCMFGTDYPVLRPGYWLEDFEKPDFKPEVRPKILLENAKRILKLDI